jgi:hypothetical protein
VGGGVKTVKVTHTDVFFDDQTGQEIEKGGWKLVRIRDGVEYHFQSVINLILWVAEGNLPGFGSKTAKVLLERRGITVR